MTSNENKKKVCGEWVQLTIVLTPLTGNNCVGIQKIRITFKIMLFWLLFAKVFTLLKKNGKEMFCLCYGFWVGFSVQSCN